MSLADMVVMSQLLRKHKAFARSGVAHGAHLGICRPGNSRTGSTCQATVQGRSSLHKKPFNHLHGKVNARAGGGCGGQGVGQGVQHDVGVAETTVLHRWIKQQPIPPPTCASHTSSHASIYSIPCCALWILTAWTSSPQQAWKYSNLAKHVSADCTMPLQV